MTPLVCTLLEQDVEARLGSSASPGARQAHLASLHACSTSKAEELLDRVWQCVEGFLLSAPNILNCVPGRHLQECPVAQAGKCPAECFLSAWWAPSDRTFLQCSNSATKMTGRPDHWSEPGEYNILFLGSILVFSSQDSSALGCRKFTQEGAMTTSPFAAREGTSAPQWPNVKKCCRHLVLVQ